MKPTIPTAALNQHVAILGKTGSGKSYYDCPEVRQLYHGWTFIEHTRQKHLHAQNGRGARPKEAPEVLIVNGPSFAKAT